ncbi:sulfotransferase [Aurantimonas sp. VKM B-3413]|uniref:sulfotransferase n=1 Tax=Aurantimonas sp. VKM B-3413 TaxID=2779401 RepID=UPI001E29B6E9|nr:sulfotransferase [Aurantimonas sp. VKM B-3413]MCB8839393.1 sulfotransferase [Aurantimonas sp. VKM B-3413]
MSDKPFEKFVVIVTYGRSGSTLLQTILQSLPGAFIRGENNNLLYPLFRAWKRAYGTRYNQGPEAIPAHGPWYGADEIVPRRFGEKLAAAFIDDILTPPPGVRILGFKEIRFHDAEEGEMPQFLDFIRSFFAPCKLVFNTRRSSDVARSAWWKDMEMEEILAMVEDLDRQYADYALAHPNDGFLVRYEDYTKDPDSLRGLFEFLDEPFDRARIERALSRQLSH